MHLRQLEVVSFVNRWYTKRVPFLSKMVYKKRIRGGSGGKVGGPSSYNTLLSAPLAHWAIITARSEKLCVLLLLVIVTFFAFCFLLFIVFRWNVPFSLHQSPLSTLSVIFHVKHHVAALTNQNILARQVLSLYAGERESVQFREEFANFWLFLSVWQSWADSISLPSV